MRTGPLFPGVGLPCMKGTAPFVNTDKAFVQTLQNETEDGTVPI
jgi:hypothetical protein